MAPDRYADLSDDVLPHVRPYLPPCAYGFLRPVDVPNPLPTWCPTPLLEAPSGPHDEATIAILTGIGDALAQAHIDPGPVMPLIEPIIGATIELRHRLQEQSHRTEAIGAAVAEGVAKLLRA